MTQSAHKKALKFFGLIFLLPTLFSAKVFCLSSLSNNSEPKTTAPQVSVGNKLTSEEVRELIEKKINNIEKKLKENDENLLKLILDKVQKIPLSNPSEKQIGAPSSTNQGVSIVDRPSFSELLGLAFDNDLISLGNGLTSLDLNAFAFLSLADPSILDQQTKYAKYDFWRRFGATVSLGGKGDSVDRNGDGKKEDALKAEKLTDIVTWEAKIRFIGTRDRRDDQNFNRYKNAMGDIHEKLEKMKDAFLSKHRDSWIEKSADGKHSYFLEDKVTSTLEDSGVEKELIEIAMIDKDISDKFKRTGDEIDKSPIFSVVAGGTNRRAKYGPNKCYVGLRGVWGWGKWDNTLNLDWARMDSLQPDPQEPKGQELKIAYQASTLWLKNTAISEEGIAVSAGLAAEFYKNIPAALHDSILKASIQFVYPVSKTISIPLSITWANHRDLLSKDAIIRGNIGFCVDFSQLQNKKKDAD
jgi:hypothetical protein